MEFDVEFPSVKAVGRMLGVGVGIMMLFFVAVGVLQSIAVPFFESTESIGFLLTVLVLQMLASVGVSLFYLQVSSRWDMISVGVPSRREWVWVAGALGFMLFGSLGGEVLFQALDVQLSENVVGGLFEQNITLQLVFIPLSFIVVALGEELLFRGVLQTRFAETIGGDAAVVVVSFVFILLHVPAYAASGGAVLPSIILLFVVGLGLGVSYEYTRNLIVPIIVHGTFNVVSLFIEVYLIIGFF